MCVHRPKHSLPNAVPKEEALLSPAQESCVDVARGMDPPFECPIWVQYKVPNVVIVAYRGHRPDYEGRASQTTIEMTLKLIVVPSEGESLGLLKYTHSPWEPGAAPLVQSMTRGKPTRPALLLAWLDPSDLQIQQPLEITLCSYLPVSGSLHGYPRVPQWQKGRL